MIEIVTRYFLVASTHMSTPIHPTGTQGVPGASGEYIEAVTGLSTWHMCFKKVFGRACSHATKQHVEHTFPVENHRLYL